MDKDSLVFVLFIAIFLGSAVAVSAISQHNELECIKLSDKSAEAIRTCKQ